MRSLVSISDRDNPDFESPWGKARPTVGPPPDLSLVITGWCPVVL